MQADTRKRIRAARNSISSSTRAQWSRAICERVSQLDAFLASKKVAAFLAFDGEADPLELMKVAVEQNKQVFVPIIIGKAKPLRFASWTPDSEMRENRFGILEPNVPDSELIEARDLDFVVTPLVAFDDRCNRIGVGGGYYDRSFAFTIGNSEPKLESNSKLPKQPDTHLVGFAFELQKTDRIEAQSWDVRLESVATESRLYQAV